MARSFNASSDHITAAGGPTLSPPLTIAAWFLGTLAPGNYDIASFGINAGGEAYRLNVTAGNAIQADHRSSGGADSTVATTTTFSTGAWNHGCAVFLGNGTNTLIAYLNGGGKNTGNDVNATVSVQGISIGSLNLTGVGNFNYWGGSLAIISVWNVQLGDLEILALAKGVRPNLIRPLSRVGDFPLDGLQSPEPDLSGNANNGVLTGTAQVFGPPIMPFTRRWPQFNFIPPPPPFTLMPQIIT
jgi:hypothetical protein